MEVAGTEAEGYEAEVGQRLDAQLHAAHGGEEGVSQAEAGVDEGGEAGGAAAVVGYSHLLAAVAFVEPVPDQMLQKYSGGRVCRVHAVVAQDRLHENNALAVARDERLEVFVARVLPRRLFGHGVHVARLRGAGRGMHA